MLGCCVLVCVLACGLALPESHKKNETYPTDNIKLDIHRVVTEDLFVLEVLRIQNVKKYIKEKKHSVLILHGMFESSDSLIKHGRHLSLAFNLADAGFNVWLGNNRGNKYSRNHIYLNPDDPVDKPTFFNYTYEDIGLYDITAIVDYILEQTNTTKLHYIGFSQGGTAFLALNTLQPNYNEKFLTAHLLAAVGYQKHFPDPVLSILSNIVNSLYVLLLKLGITDIFPFESTHQHPVYKYMKNETLIDFCIGDDNFKGICAILNKLELLGNGNARGSTKQLVHFGQNIQSKLYRRWDFGTKTNALVYGTEEPPCYNLSLVTVDTVLHYGTNDHLVSSQDVLDMAKDMPNVQTREVEFKRSDFLDAPNAKERVYNFIVDALTYYERYNKIKIVDKRTTMPINNKSNANYSTYNTLNAIALISHIFSLKLISE